MPETPDEPQEPAAPALSLDLQGGVLEANEQATALLGIPRSQWRTRPLTSFVISEHRQALSAVLDRLREADEMTEMFRCELEPLDGEQGVPVQMAISRSGSSERLSVTLHAGHGDATAISLTGRLTELERRFRATIASIDIGLRPRPLQNSEVDIGFEAISGDQDSPFGGDLCDWQLLPDGRVHLCVVDATGHGLLATRAALIVRSTVRLLALTGCPIEDLLERAERVSEQQEPGISAAVSVAHYLPEDGQLKVTNAGNPPPLFQHRDGSATQIDVTGTPFGHDRPQQRPVTDIDLAPDEAFVLYTDGLIRGYETPLDGVEDLRSRLEGLTRHRQVPENDGEAVQIAHALLPTGTGDDALALVVRRPLTGPRERSTATDQRFSARLSKAGEQHVAEVRQEFILWLTERPVPRDVVRTALLIVSELATNAVRAAHSHATIDVTLEDRSLRIEVVDDGAGIDLDDLGTLGQPGDGYGLHIVGSVCNDVQILPRAVGTVVRCRLPIGS